MAGDARAEKAAGVLDHLRSEAIVHTTPCDHGDLVWQQWPREVPAESSPAESSPASKAVPLLLLHGGFGSWSHWAANIATLRQQREVWTLDMPGLGASADCPEPHTPEHISRIVLRGLDTLLGPANKFELAGFSFGAMVGARLAILAGSRCCRFTAIGAAGCGDLHVQVHLQHPPRACPASPGAPETPPAEARSIHSANLRALMFASNDSIDDLAIHIHGENLARHRFNSRKLSLTEDFLQALPLIKARLVGVWGSRDATAGGRTNLEKRRALFKAAQKGAEFHILDGVGHWAMYEAPDAINKILLHT
jgi:2-hydroxy-6-oxonona-2,4-dienedioate hydrolase